MQLYAHDSRDSLVFSCNAEKHINYFCLECRSIVRVREGVYRQPHFYHLKLTHQCSQNAKSLTHIRLQIYLKELMPDEDVYLEHRFLEIKRIADVAWHSKKIIFEIQCSPLSKEEMQARTKDYYSLGYEVVFILHDKRFNQRRLSAVEMGLLDQTHYYTNMNQAGNGMIYDQWQFIERGQRKSSLPPLPVDLSKPYLLNNRIGFKGDVRSLPKGHFYLTKIESRKKELKQQALNPLKIFDALSGAFHHFIRSCLKPYCD